MLVSVDGVVDVLLFDLKKSGYDLRDDKLGDVDGGGSERGDMLSDISLSTDKQHDVFVSDSSDDN